MRVWIALISCVGLLGLLVGFPLLVIGSERMPTRLTPEEALTHPSPQDQNAFLLEKRTSSDGYRMMLVGGSILGGALVAQIALVVGCMCARSREPVDVHLDPEDSEMAISRRQ